MLRNKVDLELSGAIERAKDAARKEAALREIQGGIVGVASGVLTLQEKATIDKIPRATHAGHRSYRSQALGGCLDGTRVDVLDEIELWFTGEVPDEPPVLWLHGMAGEGKTAIAYTMAERAHTAGKLGGSYFFSRDGQAELCDPSLVFPTLVYQLSIFSLEFLKKFVAALHTNPDAATYSLKDQCDLLLLNPLRQLQSTPRGNILLVLDALDECAEEGAAELLSNIFKVSSQLPFLKFLITSRPEPRIATVVDKENNCKTVDLNAVDGDIVLNDAKTYLTAKLRDIQNKFKLPEEWPLPSDIDDLAKLTGKLFILGSTSVRFIGDDRVRDPQAQLRIVLSHSTSPQTHPELDTLYLKILQNSLSSANVTLIVTRFKAVMGVLLNSYTELTPSMVDEMVEQAPGTTLSALEHLRSVVSLTSPVTLRPVQVQRSVDIGPGAELENWTKRAGSDSAHKIIEFCHPSFPDYLRNSVFRSDERFHVDPKQAQTRQARWSLGRLRKGEIDAAELIANMTPKGNYTRNARDYAMRFWRQHLEAASMDDDSLQAELRHHSKCLAAAVVMP